MNFSGKILLVDDEPHIRKFMGLVLKTLGQPQIIEAANGAEGLQAFASETPDLVLLDVNMPVMDGVQALAGIIKTDPGAVVVMLTSLVNRQTVEECLRLGATGYIRKDTPREELKNELQRIIGENFEESETTRSTSP